MYESVSAIEERGEGFVLKNMEMKEEMKRRLRVKEKWRKRKGREGVKEESLWEKRAHLKLKLWPLVAFKI